MANGLGSNSSGGLCNEVLGKISCTNNTSLNSRLQFFTICPSTRKLQYRTIHLSTRSCDALQYISQLEVAMLYNTSLNSKLRCFTIPLSTRSCDALQYLSQLEVAMLYNTSLNSKLRCFTIPLSTRSYNILKYLSQFKVTMPYNASLNSK